MATTVISSMIYVPWLQLIAKISDSGHMLPEGPGIAFKYTDLPVFLLNSEYKYSGKFSKILKKLDFVHTIYGDLGVIAKYNYHYSVGKVGKLTFFSLLDS